MPHNPADDIPAPTVQDDPVAHTGATCPLDGTLVTCGGPRGATTFQGSCPACGRVVYADASLVTQTGSFDAPDEADLNPPSDEDQKEGEHGGS